MMSTQACAHLEICNGCHFGKTLYADQLVLKKQTLLNHLGHLQPQLPDIAIKSAGANELRERFDFTVEGNRMGLYSQARELVEIKNCLQVTPSLQKAFEDLKTVQFPIKKGSVRLRVSPSDPAKKGIWLDFANLDIKHLLAEEKTFDQLLALNFEIEIGQKGKSLQKTNLGYKLLDPKPNFWFQTKKFQLQNLISSFTQPSSRTADLITDTILEWLPQNTTSVAEFGAGIGQFTLPLLNLGLAVDVFEYDETACQLLKMNAKTNQLDQRLSIYNNDFQKNSISEIKYYDAVLVNPPRSGLKNFVDEIVKIKTKHIIYVSCFPESLAIDLEKLLCNAYQIKEISLIDQFPQTKHFETCVLLQGIDF